MTQFTATVRTSALFAVLLLLAVALFPIQSYAVVVCYDLKLYPAVGALEQTDSGFRAVVMDGRLKETVDGQDSSDSARPEVRRPVVQYSNEAGWRRTGRVDCDAVSCFQQSVQTCSELPDRESIPSTSSSNVCADGPTHRYFGSSYYAGEGNKNVGGWGWYNSDGERVFSEHRFDWGTSVNTILHDGTGLWMGTTYEGECTGQPPSDGLFYARPHADLGPLEPSRPLSRNALTCSFVYHDMLMVDGDLWISGDMGLTRLDLNTDRPLYPDSTHYVPTSNPDQPMREVECGTLYRTLLDDLVEQETERMRMVFSRRSSLLRNMSRFKHHILHGYIRELEEQLDQATSSDEAGSDNASDPRSGSDAGPHAD